MLNSLAYSQSLFSHQKYSRFIYFVLTSEIIIIMKNNILNNTCINGAFSLFFFFCFCIFHFESHVCRESRNSLLFCGGIFFSRTMAMAILCLALGHDLTRGQYTCDKKCLPAAIFSRGRRNLYCCAHICLSVWCFLFFTILRLWLAHVSYRTPICIGVFGGAKCTQQHTILFQ